MDDFKKLKTNRNRRYMELLAKGISKDVPVAADGLAAAEVHFHFEILTVEQHAGNL